MCRQSYTSIGNNCRLYKVPKMQSDNKVKQQLFTLAKQLQDATKTCTQVWVMGTHLSQS